MSIPRIATYPMPAPADFPANRVDWRPDPARAALLIHDMQQHFLDFYDRAAEPLPALLANIARLRDASDAAGLPVFYTAQPGVQPAGDRALLNEFWGPGLTARPERAAIEPALAPRAGHVVIDKWRYSAFTRSDLAERLRAAGRDQLIVCGVYAHIGCLVTAADGFMRDLRVFAVGDALADFSAAEHATALGWIAGRCGMVAGTDAVCAALGAPAAGVTIEPPPVTPLPASLDALRAEVAALLDLPSDELGADDNLLDAGLDSIRLMALVERWRAAGAAGLEFVHLAAAPTLARWLDRLGAPLGEAA
ncbi:isochorismatase family protein [Derxia gummosa]|uniref:isochorismatase n=1 Tax=Derxia gummosa DSM 723 TaxID=1121388 RepID=A0A8B6X4R7_9BURK|nr:isochorismatase family protein [Derxia gummosa]